MPRRPEHLVYTVYGFCPRLEFSIIGFNGQWFDPVTKCSHLGNGHRILSATLARFLSPDSLSPFGIGGLNSYAYCRGDPVNLIDTTGRSGRQRPTQRPGTNRRAAPYVLPDRNRNELHAVPNLNRAGAPHQAPQNRQQIQAPPVGAPVQPAGILPGAPNNLTRDTILNRVVRHTVEMFDGHLAGNSNPDSPQYPQWLQTSQRLDQEIGRNNLLVVNHLPEYMTRLTEAIRDSAVRHLEQNPQMPISPPPSPPQ